MSRSRKGVATGSKWQWRSASSLTTHLLIDVPPEIELSEYQRLPHSGSESPSGLLNGEGLKIELIADLDLFFERLYNYYCQKGLWCIILKWIVEILTVSFVIFFIGFFLLYVDWSYLRNAKCGSDAFESGNKPCNLAKDAIKDHPLVPFTFLKGVIVGTMVILAVYGLFNFLQFILQFKETLKIRNFYYSSLNISDHEIQTTPWPVILDKVVQLQQTQKLCVVKDLSAHDVVMRMMRKENYLIGMLNKGVLAFPISKWLPGAGPVDNSKSNGRRNRLILSKTFELSLNWCIFQSMFDSNFCIRKDFLANPSLLKKRLIVVGICLFLMSPCLFIFMLVYLFLRHAEQFYRHPSIASSRRWSNLSKWIFREFNEVDHLFIHRINNSVEHSSNYLKQFPSPLVTTIAKFVSFVSGGFAAILIIIAFLDESLLEGHIFGRNLLWFAAVIGAVSALSRATMTDELQVLDPEGAMSLVVQHTHYMPKRWRGKEHTDLVRTEFGTLFQCTLTVILEEAFSILVTAYLLVLVVPKQVDDILSFISDFTVDIEGVGHVCSFSLFDFESHGNIKYGSPCDAARERRSSQGKMEKSFLSFQSAYPTWEPSAQGQQLLSMLRNFRDKQMLQVTQQEYFPYNIQQFTPAMASRGEMLQRPLLDVVCNGSGISSRGYHPGSLWLINPEQRTYPYILDCYYISRPQCTGPLHTAVDESEDAPSLSNEAACEQPEDLCSQQDQLLEHTKNEKEDWSIPFADRLESHMEASTSNPLFMDSVLHHENLLQHHHTSGHWWARSPHHSSGAQASFLEPPSFGHYNFSHHSDDLSDSRSIEEQKQYSGRDTDWRSLSRTYYMDDSDKAEGFHRPFMDVFSDPLKTLPVRIIPRSNDPV